MKLEDRTRLNESVFVSAALLFQTGARAIAGGAMLCNQKGETTFFIWVGFLNKAKAFFLPGSIGNMD